MKGSALSHSSALPAFDRGHHHAPPVSTPSRIGKEPIAPLRESPVRSATKLPLRSSPAPTHQPGQETPPAALATSCTSGGPDNSILESTWLARYTLTIDAVPGVTAPG